MSHMEVDHGGGDLLVAKQSLHRMQTASRFDEVGGKAMAQGMRRGVRNAKSFACHNHQTLKGSNGHRRAGIPHAASQIFGITGTTARIGEEKHRVTVEFPVAAQVFDHLRSQRHHPVLGTLAATNHDLAFVAQDVMHGQRKALGKPQARAVDQFDGRAIPPQPNGAQKTMDLIPGENGGQFVMILGADLGKYFPFRMPQHLDEKNPGTRHRLPDGLGLPCFAGFDVQDVVAELILSQSGRVNPEVFVNEAHGPVIAVPGAR